MATLASRIMERFESGATLERADLTFDANPDSVGRALNQLIRDKQLIRVGRGRYRKVAGAKTIVSTNTIADAIERKLRRSRRNVFVRSDFANLGSYDAVGRALREKAREGSLVQIGYGLYAKAQLSPFTGKAAPLIGIKRLATEALRRLGKDVVNSSIENDYNQRRSTQVPTGRALAVKDRVRRKIGYDGNYVVLERAR